MKEAIQGPGWHQVWHTARQTWDDTRIQEPQSENKSTGFEHLTADQMKIFFFRPHQAVQVSHSCLICQPQSLDVPAERSGSETQMKAMPNWHLAVGALTSDL